jgi:DNA-binding MarR family transcriptional regulator
MDAALAVADLETRTTRTDHEALRLWLRLLATANSLEALVRGRLQSQFGTTLARFDYLAQLDRATEGLRMRELSERLMVTGGNVTGLTDALVRDGYVTREIVDEDRRACKIRLTSAGRRLFRAMAKEHEAWIVEVCGALGSSEISLLKDLLGRLKIRVRSILQGAV